MTIILTKPVRVGGVELAAATTQTFAADVEADLVARGCATYYTSNSIAVSVSAIGFERIDGGPFCDWGPEFGALTLVSANAAEAVAIDSTVTIGGQSAVKCTFSTAASATYIARWTPTNTISLKNFTNIRIPFKITGCDLTCSTGLAVWLKCASGKNIRLTIPHTATVPGEWNFATWNKAEISGTVSFAGGATGWDLFDSEQVNAIDIIASTVTASNGYPIWLGPIAVNTRAKKGMLSLRMDGEYDSQYTLIAPLLAAAKMTASLALTHADIGTGGRMSAAQISEMYAAGHEVILHTFDSSKVNGYANATDWPSGYLITQDINAAWAAQRAAGWTRGIGKMVEGFSGNYFGASTAAARQKLLKSAFRAAAVEAMAMITTGYNMNSSGYPLGIRTPIIRCNKSITSSTTAGDVIAVIDAAIAAGEWACLVAHKAVADSATPSGNEMRISDFATWIAYAASKVASGNLIVAGLSEIYDLIHKNN